MGRNGFPCLLQAPCSNLAWPACVGNVTCVAFRQGASKRKSHQPLIRGVVKSSQHRQGSPFTQRDPGPNARCCVTEQRSRCALCHTAMSGRDCGAASALVPMPPASSQEVDAFALSSRAHDAHVRPHQSRRLLAKSLCLLLGVVAVAAVVGVVVLVRGPAGDDTATHELAPLGHVQDGAGARRRLTGAGADPQGSNCTQNSGRAAFGTTSFWINAAVSVGECLCPACPSQRLLWRPAVHSGPVEATLGTGAQQPHSRRMLRVTWRW